MANPDEVKLIRAARDGSEEAFREIVERYQKRTYWIAYTMVGRYEAAQDISQEAFVRVYKALDTFDTGKNFYTWLYQIVVNLSIDYLRKKSNARSVGLDDIGDTPDLAADPRQEIDRKEVRQKVLQVLNQLPLKYKTVLILRDIQGLTCEEIADSVGSTHPTVRWRLHRARKIFKSLWEGKKVGIDEDGSRDEEV